MIDWFYRNKNKIENYALSLTLEFGENWGGDISEKLQSRFPNLTKKEIEYYKQLAKNVETDCWNCIDDEYSEIDSKQLSEFPTTKVFLKYTWINKRNKVNINSKFQYYFWREGRLK
ncbi:hypothetical protein [Riemerella anatipestifer]|uniref:Uncharacterized protein n=1 Tax=Riemerella anatipestifer RA-CH-1 TaxID=1228997 RepID=J9R9H1_RIEAN|nr:hypothetical protein [Riemerella anatipestifer]AFR36337.1 hypothetical protein B739_1753 [Riemerella anatipestifer RA-CH-1]AIH03295.1 hypothetical protein M949_2129 [Riemerella anatipestifer CH3]MCO7331651.1 hypothetical protein [Riemerella anatipestifer]MCO7350537.1 hypothetical protein [Riemerella anatipestifer]MCU7582644.1 hypothetical protein [Riemerella anatipestifer]